MTQPSRRRASGNTTRRQRRATGVRTYTTPAASTTPASPTASAPRRSYMVEPTPIDHATEYRFIRKDLIRILIWATVLIGAMVALWVLQIF